MLDVCVASLSKAAKCSVSGESGVAEPIFYF